MPPQAIKVTVEHSAPDLVRITMGPKTLELSAQSALDMGAAMQAHGQALLDARTQPRSVEFATDTPVPARLTTMPDSKRNRAGTLIAELLNLITNEGHEDDQAAPPTPPTADPPPSHSGPARLSPPETGGPEPAVAGAGTAGG